MRFAKLHGLGNDFVLLDRRGGGVAPPAAEAAQLCDRHRGVGADGVLTLLAAPGADARLVIHNADGSVPEMCGNGARCAALWVATAGGERPARGAVLLATDAGPRPCLVDAPGPAEGTVEIEMGPARVESARELPLGGRRAPAHPVSLGNPHRVIFLQDALSPAELAGIAGDDALRARLTKLASELGPVLCRAENANIEFAARLAGGGFAAAVWERGAGLTQACGTGACAVAAAAVALGFAPRGLDVVVELPGGPLSISVAAAGVKMRGPAKLVFRGEL